MICSAGHIAELYRPESNRFRNSYASFLSNTKTQNLLIWFPTLLVIHFRHG